MSGNIEIFKGDITKFEIEAIVNAANNSLLGGGGVNGAIHAAAGPELLEECRTLGGCETGQAKISKGYNLPARFVIHTVGPVWRGGNNNEEDLLANAYRNSLELAVKNGIREIAFPSISTGVYSFPLERAASIALAEINKFLDASNPIDLVVMVCFGDIAFAAYSEALANLMD